MKTFKVPTRCKCYYTVEALSIKEAVEFAEQAYEDGQDPDEIELVEVLEDDVKEVTV